jgi:hypothetical protein
MQKEKKRQESFEEFCKRLGIRIVNEKGGVEFVPYRGKASRIKISKQRSGAGKRSR